MTAPGTAGPKPEGAEVPISRRLGRYQLRYLVAQGGMASVCLAQLSSGEGFSKWVAVKTIQPHIATDPRFVQMFLNEARLAARIDHPNVCTVFDFGESEGVYYLAMEYLHGESLSRVTRRAWKAGRGLGLGHIARIISDAARGLHAAHEIRMDDGQPAGVVHRDISPQNLFVLYGGVTKVVDFGIARSAAHIGEATATGEIKGKLAYMSPEQVRAKTLDRRADIWALGVVLWEAVVGERLFKREHDAATMYAVLEDEIPPASSRRRGVPPALDAIIRRALERNIAQRYPTALAMARDLESFIASTGAIVGPDDVADVMSQLFAAEIATRDELLTRRIADDAPPQRVMLGGDPDSSSASGIAGRSDVQQPLPVEQVELDSSDLRTEISSVGGQPPQPVLLLTQPAVPRGHGEPIEASPPANARNRRPLVIAIVFVVSALAGSVGVMAGLRRSASTGPSAAPATAGVTPVATTASPAHTEATPPVVPIATPDAATPPVAHADAGTRAAPPRDHRAAHEPRTPRPPAEPTAAPPIGTGETAMGSLTLFSSVPCDVFEGSRHIGSTPMIEHRLSVGRHTLRVTPRNGDLGQDANVNIEAGAASMLTLHWNQ